LPRGRTYTFDFKINRMGSELVFRDVAAKFRVDWWNQISLELLDPHSLRQI
jgi:hypothetical protein